MTQRRCDGGRPLQPERQQQEGTDRHQRGPHHEGELVDGAMFGHRARDDVATCPGRSGTDGQGKAQQGHGLPVAAANQGQACPRQHQARQLVGLPVFTQKQRGKHEGEKRLRLQHQRGQARGHAHVDGGEQQGELPHRNQHAVGQVQPQRHAGCAKKQQRGKRRTDEAQRRQQHGRHARHAQLDDGEVEPPHHDGQQGQRQVFERHLTRSFRWRVRGPGQSRLRSGAL